MCFASDTVPFDDSARVLSHCVKVEERKMNVVIEECVRWVSCTGLRNKRVREGTICAIGKELCRYFFCSFYGGPDVLLIFALLSWIWAIPDD